MISDKKLRSSIGCSQFQLGLNSYACFERKKSATTQQHTNDSVQDDSLGNQDHSNLRTEQFNQNCNKTKKVQQLKLKLLKLADHKANMELKFKKQIIVLSNQLSVINSEQEILVQFADNLKNNIQDMKADLQFIRKCNGVRKTRNSISPQLSRMVRESRASEKYCSRNKPSRLFKANMLKIK